MPPAIPSVSVFRDRNFVLFLIGQMISTQGLWIQKIAMAWLAWTLTGSAFWTGFIAALNFAPAVLLGPVFGVMADRVDLRRMAMILNAAMAAIAVALMAMSWAGYINLFWMVVFSAANGIVASAMTPVRLALVPIIVRREHMSRAVTYAAMNFNISRLVGPAIGSLVIASAGVGAAFLINALSYLPFVFILGLLHIHVEHAPDAKSRRVLAALVDGASYAVNHPMIRSVLGLSCFVALVGTGMVELLPVFSDAVYERGVTGLGILSSAAGIGAVASTLMMSQLPSEPYHFKRIAIIGAFLAGCGLIGLGFAPWFELAVVLVVLSGFGLTAVGVGSQTALQLAVDNTLRGRVMSFWSATSFGGIALGGTLLGAISEFAGVQITARGSGILIVLAAIFAGWRLCQNFATPDGQTPHALPGKSPDAPPES
ncbi:MFS transporter [Thalassospira sp.]|uniref:MFS transporter n=1 Tax=Thalassospira sp. TaxID=1912094 RepID=UPI0027358564|nr:MFS transporter [Thalassospira sp.]MDP2699372.1 MFS transporter [Thalassospira sp.]